MMYYMHTVSSEGKIVRCFKRFRESICYGKLLMSGSVMSGDGWWLISNYGSYNYIYVSAVIGGELPIEVSEYVIIGSIK